MRALRRKLTKGPAPSNTGNNDPSAAKALVAGEMTTVGSPAGGHKNNVAIAGELSPTPSTSRHGRKLVRNSKGSLPTPPLNRKDFFQLPSGMTQISSKFL